jgi:hypothetical protein
MPLPIIAGCVRGSFLGTLTNGKPWANVVGLRYAGGASNPGQNEITAANAVMVRLWNGTPYTTGVPWLTHCAAGVTMAKAIYYVLDGQSPPYEINNTATGGGANGAEAPGEVAFVLTLRTNFRGRQNRGRLYMPAPTVASLDTQGKLSQAHADNLVTQANGVLGGLAAIQWEWGVLSMGPYKAGQVPTPTPHFTPITRFTMDTLGDVQRRRK